MIYYYWNKKGQKWCKFSKESRHIGTSRESVQIAEGVASRYKTHKLYTIVTDNGLAANRYKFYPTIVLQLKKGHFCKNGILGTF